MTGAPPGVEDAPLEEMLRHALGGDVRVTRRRSLGGGFGSVERLETTAGTFVAKSYEMSAVAMCQAEGLGLAALRDAGSPVTVPRVIASQDAPPLLILEYVAGGSRRPDFDERLGRGLAALHRTTAQWFGFAGDTYCGATRQPNAWQERWVPFYAQSRLTYQATLASLAHLLTTTELTRLERLVATLDSWLDEPPSGPALIHGDLWSGNVCIDADGGPALIDPAAYYGHREAELGMMTLFGGFSPRVYDAYDEAFPLQSGWRERMPLYQLYHVLNHLNLFGASYHAQVRAILDRYVA